MQPHFIRIPCMSSPHSHASLAPCSRPVHPPEHSVLRRQRREEEQHVRPISALVVAHHEHTRLPPQRFTLEHLTKDVNFRGQNLRVIFLCESTLQNLLRIHCNIIDASLSIVPQVHLRKLHEINAFSANDITANENVLLLSWHRLYHGEHKYTSSYAHFDLPNGGALVHGEMIRVAEQELSKAFSRQRPRSFVRDACDCCTEKLFVLCVPKVILFRVRAMFCEFCTCELQLCDIDSGVLTNFTHDLGNVTADGPTRCMLTCVCVCVCVCMYV